MGFFSIVFLASSLVCLVAALTILDNTSSLLTYSNSGPQWHSSDWHNGGGWYVSGQIGGTQIGAYKFSWQESLGDGASVSLAFTGTHVILIGTIANSGYNTTIDFFIDERFISRFQKLVPGPQHAHEASSPYLSDVTLQYTLGDFPNLAPARHTFKAVSVGDDSLFVVDAIQYEPSDAVPTSSTESFSITTYSANSTRSSSSITGEISITSLITNLTSSSTASRSTTSQSSQSTTSATISELGAVVAAMDVPASDPHIVYSPPEAWMPYSNARRATSCLEGTRGSSTASSFLTYNFTGSAVQVYTVSSSVGGNYSISIDGENRDIYASYDASAEPSACSSRPLYSKIGLNDTQHTLVLTVQEHTSDSARSTIQFVGFRISPTATGTPNSPSTPGLNLGAILGGALGGACVLLIMLGIIWRMRRQRRKEDELLAQIMDTEPYSSSADGSLDPDSPSEIHIQEPPTRIANHLTTVTTHGPALTMQHLQPPTIVIDDSLTERVTLYTLPSYHENVMQRAAARNLSEADVEAISRRMGEVMRNYGEQNGNSSGAGDIIPPRELIDHLVEEHLQPRASNPAST